MVSMKRLIASGWGFLRYCLTGGASLVAYVGVSNVLYHAGLHPTPSTLFAWSVAALVAYFGHIYFSYRVQADHKRMVLRFLGLLGLNFVQTVVLTWLLYDLFKVGYSLTSVIVGISSPLVSYPIGKWWVFNEKTETDG